MWKPDDSADKSGKRGLDILADSNKRRTLAMDEIVESTPFQEDFAWSRSY